MSEAKKRGLETKDEAAEVTEATKKKMKMELEHQMMDKVGPGPGRKRKRHRKLYKTISDQMAFYFSDANLSKSTFMAEQMEKSPWIQLETFLKFNKLADMLKMGFDRVCLDDLWTALKAIQSEVYEVKEESGTKVIRRSKEIVTKNHELTEKCTLYVENLPPFATIDSLRNMFSKFGSVDYVSLPRYKHNMAIKGFAFVEFKEESGAKATIERSESRMNPEEKDPAELQTVKAYNKEQAIEKGINKEENAEDEENTEDNDKKKCRSKKSSHHHQNHQQENESHLMASLRIMTKTEWRRLRNKYLNLQKKNMSVAKGRIRQMQVMHERRSGGGATSQTPEPPPEPKEPPTVSEALDFVSGVIVKFPLNEPIIENGKQYKSRIRAAVMEPVKYVDATNGKMQLFVRCANSKQADTIANAKGIVGVVGEVLQGPEESEYWSKIRKDRSDKISGKIKVPSAKIRGKDRVVKKYEETVRNTHRFFDDDE